MIQRMVKTMRIIMPLYSIHIYRHGHYYNFSSANFAAAAAATAAARCPPRNKLKHSNTIHSNVICFSFLKTVT